MEISADKRIFGLLQAVIITAGFVFAALFVQDVWIRREVDLQRALGNILFFGAAGLELLPSLFENKISVKRLGLALSLAVLGAILIKIGFG